MGSREHRPAAESEHIREVVLRTFEAVQGAASMKKPMTGLPTGLTKLDEMTAGLRGGQLVIVAGRPAMGKTALSIGIAVSAVQRSNMPIAFFSLETRRTDLATRLLCSEAKVDGGRMRTGMLSRDDWSRLAGAAGPLTALPIYVHDTARTLTEIEDETRRLQSAHGIGLVVVDYVQLMRSGERHETREQEVSEISRSLKALSKELDVPVIVLSQMNRAVESRPGRDKRPVLSDLRDSGALEDDADLVLFVYRPEMYARDEERAQLRGLAEVIVAKQRSGPTGIIKCRFFHEFARFEDLAEGEFDDYDAGFGGD